MHFSGSVLLCIGLQWFCSIQGYVLKDHTYIRLKHVWLEAGRHDIGLLYRASTDTDTVLFQTDDQLWNIVVFQITGLIPQLPTSPEWYTLFLTMNVFLLALGLITEILQFIYSFAIERKQIHLSNIHKSCSFFSVYSIFRNTSCKYRLF